MEVLAILVPLAIFLGALGLAAFLWSLRTGQYDDLDGAAWRAILDDEPTVSPDDGEKDDRQRKCHSDPDQQQRPVDPLPM